MPDRQNRHRHDDRHELERGEVHLICHESATDVLGRLGEAEGRAQEYQRGDEEEREDEEDEQGEVDGGGCGLQGQAAEQDGVRRRRDAALALAGADQRGAGDLGNGGDDVTGDEDQRMGRGRSQGRTREDCAWARSIRRERQT